MAPAAVGNAPSSRASYDACGGGYGSGVTRTSQRRHQRVADAARAPGEGCARSGVSGTGDALDRRGHPAALEDGALRPIEAHHQVDWPAGTGSRLVGPSWGTSCWRNRGASWTWFISAVDPPRRSPTQTSHLVGVADDRHAACESRSDSSRKASLGRWSPSRAARLSSLWTRSSWPIWRSRSPSVSKRP